MTIEPMKKLGKAKQISYRSTPEIVGRLDLAAAKLAVDTDFDGAKLRTGHLVNAVALWLARLPEDELRRFARPLLRDLESFLGREGGEEGRDEGEEGLSPEAASAPTRKGLTPVDMTRLRGNRGKRRAERDK